MVHSQLLVCCARHGRGCADCFFKVQSYVPPDLRADGLEINRFTTKEEMLKKFAYLKRFNFITDSDAHFIDNIGDVYNVIYMEHRTFDEFRKALKGEDGRYIDTMAFRTAPLKKIL